MGNLTGTTLGRYQIQERLGQGGMAEVYKAYQPALDRYVAVKVLHSFLLEHEVSRRRFQREARAVAALRHPHIVQVIDFDAADDLYFMVMELIEGPTLKQVVADQTRAGALLPLARVGAIIVAIGGALGYAHEQGIIHRDIKPQNIMFSANGQPLLTDFGIARILSSASISGSGTLSGTPAYMSPEQGRGDPLDARTDIYSLGVVLYEMLTGQVPFTADTAFGVVLKHLNEPPPAPGRLVADLPPALDQVVLTALAKAPQDRFPTAGALVAATWAALERGALGPDAPDLSAPAAAFVLAAPPLTPAPGAVLPPAAPPPDQETPHLTEAPAQATPSQHTPAYLPAAERYDDAPPTNLPTQLTTLVGREQTLGRAVGLLRRTDVRLLTVTGPGGVGKTRLALQVGHRLLWDFAGGVYLVELAPLTDPALVLSAIAHTLGVQEAPGRLLAESLVSHLQATPPLLLVLDNFEQVMEAASHVTMLLLECPRLKILVTSRAVLRVRGEHELEVPPLALPDEGQTNPETLAECASVALFVWRAAVARPDFILTPQNAPIVAEICRRVDGLPLAIELAAAHSRALTPQSMLERMKKKLPVLIGHARDLPARHKTLRAAMEWSYDLLTEAEKRLFGRAAIFVGGFTLEAVEAVCGALPGAAEDDWTILEGIESLLDKSLLRHVEAEGGESRYVMLETIREYGGERLAAEGEREAIAHAYAAYYLALVEAADPKLLGAEQQAWLAKLALEHDNLRAALTWALDQELPTALGIAGSLWRFWYMRGYFSEGRDRLAQVLALAGAAPADPDAAAALTAPATLVRQAKVLNGSGVLRYVQGDIEEAKHFFAQSLDLCRAVGDKPGITAALNNLGAVAVQQGDYVAAMQIHEEALALRREMGDKWGVASSLGNLGGAAMAIGDYGRAVQYSEEALVVRRELGDKHSIAITLNNLGALAAYQHEYARSVELHEEALAIRRELGDRQGISISLSNLGRSLLGQGAPARARLFLEESLAIRQELGDKAGLLEVMEGLAGVAVADGYATGATRLLSAVAVARETLGAPLPPVDEDEYAALLAAVRARLTPDSFAAAWAVGRTMTSEQALAQLATSTEADALPRPAAGTAPPPPPAVRRDLLSQEAFATAAQDLLRNYARPYALHNSPLLHSALVAERAGRAGSAALPVEVLREAARAACDVLQGNPRDTKLYRALYHTYIEPAATQEQAAEVLDLPFSTYRRHLKDGLARVTAILWDWEQQARRT